MTWAKKIKKLRLAMCYTQQEFAKLIGVSFVSINRYENARHEPTMKVKRKLMEFLAKYNIRED